MPTFPQPRRRARTRDIVHRFYQEQYQLNDRQQNRYVTGSDAIGLTMGYYDTSALPINEYLHTSSSRRHFGKLSSVNRRTRASWGSSPTGRLSAVTCSRNLYLVRREEKPFSVGLDPSSAEERQYQAVAPLA